MDGAEPGGDWIWFEWKHSNNDDLHLMQSVPDVGVTENEYYGAAACHTRPCTTTNCVSSLAGWGGTGSSRVVRVGGAAVSRRRIKQSETHRDAQNTTPRRQRTAKQEQIPQVKLNVYVLIDQFQYHSRKHSSVNNSLSKHVKSFRQNTFNNQISTDKYSNTPTWSETWEKP